MSLPSALLLDSTFLHAYERDVTRVAQALVVEAIVDGRLLIVPAASLTAAGVELGGRQPELSWLLNDPDSPVQVLDLTATNALETGARAARAGKIDPIGVEVAQIAIEASGSPTAVLTYEPKRYVGFDLRVMDMRPE